jgi:hypothetical protein
MVRKVLVVIALVLSLVPVAAFAQVTPPVSTPEVTPTPQPANQLKIEGIVESLQNGVLVIGGQSIDVSTAVIQPGVVVGGFAEAYVTATLDGVWVASEVELDRNVDEDDLAETEIEGIVTEVGTDFVVIGGRTFDISLADLEGAFVAGDFIELELRLSRTGQWVTVEVEFDADDDDRDDRGGRDDDDRDDNSGPGSDDDDE